MGTDNQIKLLLTVFVDYVLEENYCIPFYDKIQLIERLQSNNWNDATPLQLFVKSVLDPILSILIRSNGDVKFTENNGNTILHLFLIGFVKKADLLTHEKSVKDIRVVEYLLQQGASVVALRNRSNTPLGIVLEKRRLDLIRVMQAYLGNVNDTINGLDETFLHILVEDYVEDKNDRQIYLNQILQIIRDLRAGGAHINKVQYAGMTAAHLAAENCHFEILKELADNGSNLKYQTDEGNDVLILVCKQIWKEKNTSTLLKTVNWLLEQGSDVSLKNKRGFTALHYASRTANLDVVKALVKGGADPISKDLDNVTPLHCAALAGSSEVMHYLLECTKDIRNCRDSKYGLTPLHLVAYGLEKSKLDLFIKKDLDFDIAAKHGLTPMHLACLRGNVRIVKTLIAQGAKVDCRYEPWQYTPLHLASTRGKFNSLKLDLLDVLNFIESHIFKKRCSKTLDYKATIRLLRRAKAKIVAKDKFGWTPLHFAVRQLNADVILELLYANAAVDIQDADGLLPLHHALSCGNNYAYNVLIEFGADINDVNTPRRGNFSKIIYKYPNIADLLLFHAVKLKALGLPINDIYEPYIHTNAMQNMHVACLKEIEEMKLYMVCEDMSVYRLLKSNYAQLCKIKILPSAIKKKFRLYQNVIQATVRHARCRQKLLNEADIAFKKISKIDWPYLCTERIFSYLSNRYLQILIESVQEFE